MGFLRGKEDVITERGRIRRSGFGSEELTKPGYPPLFLVSVDSERLRYSVTSLESTLLGFLTSVDFKRVRLQK
jgi:hypothetical protein